MPFESYWTELLMIQETEQLIHGRQSRCLDHEPERQELFVSLCDVESPTQRWIFEKFNRTALVDGWDKAGIDADDF